MTGCLSSAGSGPLTSMLSNATLIVWISFHLRKAVYRKARQRKRRPRRDNAAHTAQITKEKRNENQIDQRLRGRPKQGSELLYRRIGLCRSEEHTSELQSSV